MNLNPQWLNNLHEIDRQAITELVEGDFGGLSKPRTVVFCIYDVNKNTPLKNIITELLGLDWGVEVFDDPEAQGLKMLEVSKENYVFDEPTYLRDTRYFKGLAERYGLHYDGWFANT